MIKMYGFLEGPAPTGGWEATVTCQCGVRLVRHISAKAEDAQYDVGVTSSEQHTFYYNHCSEQHQGEPFQVEWVDDSSNYQGIRQSNVEVVGWSKDDLSSLTDAFRTTFTGDYKKAPAPPEEGLYVQSRTVFGSIHR